jgi:hypothetical protein
VCGRRTEYLALSVLDYLNWCTFKFIFERITMNRGKARVAYRRWIGGGGQDEIFVSMINACLSLMLSRLQMPALGVSQYLENAIYIATDGRFSLVL